MISESFQTLSNANNIKIIKNNTNKKNSNFQITISKETCKFQKKNFSRFENPRNLLVWKIS
jgi:hypothetical protein